MRVGFTRHAKLKIEERKITVSDINRVVAKPERVEADRFDKSLTHYIGRINERFLRVIGRKEGEEAILVISAFFDRRLSRRIYRDKT